MLDRKWLAVRAAPALGGRDHPQAKPAGRERWEDGKAGCFSRESALLNYSPWSAARCYIPCFMFLTKFEIDGCLRLYAVITGSVGNLRAASRPLSSPFAFTMRAAAAGCRGDPRRASRSGMEHDVQLWPVALGFWFFRRPEAGLLGVPPDRCLVTGQWHGRHEERPAGPFYI